MKRSVWTTRPLIIQQYNWGATLAKNSLHSLTLIIIQVQSNQKRREVEAVFKQLRRKTTPWALPIVQLTQTFPISKNRWACSRPMVSTIDLSLWARSSCRREESTWAKNSSKAGAYLSMRGVIKSVRGRSQLIMMGWADQWTWGRVGGNSRRKKEVSGSMSRRLGMTGNIRKWIGF